MGHRVLIIEADFNFRSSVATHLRQAGFEILTAADRVGARAILGRQRVDVVILGLAALGAGGRQLLREIRATWPHIRLITLNQNEQIELSIEAMRQGAFADLLPPFDMEALRESVRAAVADSSKSSGGAP
ncbi:MAG: response regulator [Desulfobacterales bacterium]|jgi:DNA-binding NtrC family response regulator|nr:response regulator [Desulfobacteraceae bacterium]MDD3992495.1 response regulator [Desulfobacteraceae bacterium]MDY0311182.1 response regulator [Desulfobacterales bacterium]